MILVGAQSDSVRRDLQALYRVSKTMNRALFLDRDGVLNHDFGYVGTKEDFRFIESTIHLICWAICHGYMVILVTNQSGIGRGFFSLDQFEELMSWVDGELHKLGVFVAACYFSPTDPGVPTHAEKSNFARKPSPEMVLAAVSDFNLDVHNCVLVGDKISDAVAGQQAGIPNLVLVGGTVGAGLVDDDNNTIEVVSHARETLALVTSMHRCDSLCQDGKFVPKDYR